ncbi:MAG: 30S ribosomal protein S20 [Candidatus Nitrohelix vancouverensis]|uniref:Small ribosomal subunit protein bS20 n=1 Tax=Candidatus Nitrohelix vancouverensis TaxID=2705534 RepID=A0A7T0C183_9BACT|nr:MAG: 30S ribosomal protein S20 [Candidatus Nitrohelix vancouverensis]
MANHKSALKRNRQNEKRYARNKAHRTVVKNAIKRTMSAIEEKNKDAAVAEFKAAEKLISKVASKGAIHKSAASRKVASLAKRVHKLSVAS